MLRSVVVLSLFCAGCGVKEQPDWARTVAAYEIPLPTCADKSEFAAILNSTAQATGYHVDVASPSELAAQSGVSPITFNAAVWRGKNDDEAIASAMDLRGNLGKVWLTFSVGQEPNTVLDFRQRLMPQIIRRWPETTVLPIMPTGSIPLPDDLIKTPSGYIVKPSAAQKYQQAPQ